MKEIKFYNNATDSHDQQWANEHLIVNGYNDWDGLINIIVKSEHSIIASIQARGSEFIIVINRYSYVAEWMQEWCYYVQNHKFGGNITFEKQQMYKEINMHLPNKVDAISLTNGIMELLKDVIENHNNAVKEVLSKREQK